MDPPSLAASSPSSNFILTIFRLRGPVLALKYCQQQPQRLDPSKLVALAAAGILPGKGNLGHLKSTEELPIGGFLTTSRCNMERTLVVLARLGIGDSKATKQPVPSGALGD